MRKKLFAPVLACAMCLSLLSVPAAAQDGLSNFRRSHHYTIDRFVDVPPTIWYADSVADAYELGLVNGVGADTFDPDGNITLAASLALACRLHSTYYNNGAVFAQGRPWYLVYVEYAIQNGIISPGEFSDYTQDATRRQFAAILARALPPDALKWINVVEDGSIPDLAKGSGYYDDIYALYRAGILTGNDRRGSFGPDDTIRRSHVAAIVTRMADPELRIIRASEPTPTPSIMPFPTPPAPMPLPSVSPAPIHGPGSIDDPLNCDNNNSIAYQLHDNRAPSQINIRCTGALSGEAAARFILADNQANPLPGPGQSWQIYEFTIRCQGGSDLDIRELFLACHLRSSGGVGVKPTVRRLLDTQLGTGILTPGDTAKVTLALLLNHSDLRRGLNLGIPVQQGSSAIWIRLDPVGQGALTPPPPASAEPTVTPTAPPSPAVTPEPEVTSAPAPPPSDPQEQGTGSLNDPLPAYNNEEVNYLHGSATCPVVINCIKLDQGDTAAELALEASSANTAGENQEWRFYHFSIHYSERGTETLPVGDLITSGNLCKTDGEWAPVVRTTAVNGLRDLQDAETLWLTPGENRQAVLGILVDQTLGDLLLKIRTAAGETWIELIP